MPTRVEFAESVVHARETLVELTRLAWDFDFFEADLEAIKSDEARERLHRAVGCQVSGDTHGAMGWIRAAFEYAFANGGENLVGPVVNVAELLVVVRGVLHSSVDQDPFHRAEDAAIALRRLQILGRLTAFGMNVTQYLHWRDKFSDAPPVEYERRAVIFLRDQAAMDGAGLPSRSCIRRRFDPQHGASRSRHRSRRIQAGWSRPAMSRGCSNRRLDRRGRRASPGEADALP